MPPLVRGSSVGCGVSSPANIACTFAWSISPSHCPATKASTFSRMPRRNAARACSSGLVTAALEAKRRRQWRGGTECGHFDQGTRRLGIGTELGDRVRRQRPATGQGYGAGRRWSGTAAGSQQGQGQRDNRDGTGHAGTQRRGRPRQRADEGRQGHEQAQRQRARQAEGRQKAEAKG